MQYFVKRIIQKINNNNKKSQKNITRHKGSCSDLRVSGINQVHGWQKAGILDCTASVPCRSVDRNAWVYLFIS